MGTTIPVYFGENDTELLKKVETMSKNLHISKSGYMKMAISKDLEREENQSNIPSIKNHQNNDIGDLLDGF